MKYLGDTLDAIAGEKAGIIGPACRLAVTGEKAEGPLARIREAAGRRGARLVEMEESGHESLPPLLLAGAHQRRNAALAARAARVMHEAGVIASPLSEEAIRQGLATARWPGRLQVVGNDPLVVLDGAHNADGCAALARWLREEMDPARQRRLCLVFGALEDKQVEEMARPLFPLAERIVLTRGASPRFREPQDLLAGAQALAPGRAVVVRDAARALAEARDWAGPRGAVCLCGSLYLVGEALEILGIDPYVRDAASPSSER